MPVSYPPPSATLLLRWVLPGLVDPAQYRPREYWYDPATRTATLYLLPESSDDSTFSLPTTTLVDAYCLEVGAAPYTERQAYHNGAGGITWVLVDNVAACQIRCDLGVTLTATAVTQGRATLTATVSGAGGQVLLSLDGFQTPGLAPNAAGQVAYIDRRTGTYTVTARETRAGGCTATATLTLTAAYGPRYRLDFKDIYNADCQLLILERDYTGAVRELPTAQANPVELDWPGGATDHLFSGLVHGSECRLALFLTEADDLLPLYSGDERLHRVDYRQGGVLRWRGYLLADQYDVAHLSPPTTFDMTATDGLGTLSDMPFVGSNGETLRGDWTALELLCFCLNKLETALPVYVRQELYPSTGSSSVGALEQIRYDAASFVDDKGEPWDCGRVLHEALLRPYGARLHQWNGAWWWLRLADATTAPAAYIAYSSLGVRLADPALTTGLTTVLPPADGLPLWAGGAQRQGLRPAVASVSLPFAPGDPLNLLAFAQPRNTDLPAAVPASWSVSLDPSGASLLYEGADKRPTLRMVGRIANALRPDLAPWVQTPPTSLVPVGGTDANGRADSPDGGFVILTARLKPYNNTPNPSSPNSQSRLWVALRIGDKWVQSSGAESDTPIYEAILFPDKEEVLFSLPFGRLGALARQPISVRLVGPTGGGTPCTVDITELNLFFANGAVLARSDSPDPAVLLDTYVTTYRGNTGQFVSLRDEAEPLQFGDTAQVRRTGTVLDALGRPAQGWFEPRDRAGLRELGDYLVRDRLIWQAAPAQVLNGLLLGPLPDGPGTMLTDPAEVRPAVYHLGAVTHNAANATWQVYGVQNRQLLPPADELPDGAIYFDDLSAWLDEDGALLVYENITI